LKDYKSYNAFINFYFNFYKDDFYIFISIRPLKVRFIKFNVLKKRTSKLGLHRLKDYQRFKVSKGINIGNNGFKDSNSWESIEGRFYISEDKLYKSIES